MVAGAVSPFIDILTVSGLGAWLAAGTAFIRSATRSRQLQHVADGRARSQLVTAVANQ